MFEPSHHCTLPWTGFSNDPGGKVRPCCIYQGHVTDEAGNPVFLQDKSSDDILHSPFMKKLRQDFREGKKPPACSVCWKDEAANKKSKRQLYWRDIDYSAEPEHATQFQLIISNTCNLKCRTCSPSHSTKWYKEALDLGFMFPKEHAVEVCDEESVFWKTRHEWMRHLVDLDIVGGEPFYIKNWEVIWRELVAMDQAKHVSLGISSNGTIFNGELVEFLIDNFRSTGIGLSLDGIGKQFEYLRHPGVWSEVEANGFKYHDLNLKHAATKKFGNTITHTVSWMNIWYMPVFHQFVYDNWPEMYIWNNVVHGPAYFSPWVLPEPVKDIVRAHIHAYPFEDRYRGDINGILNVMDSRPHDPKAWEMGLAKIKQSDAYRRENFAASFPEFFEIIKPYWS